MSILNLCVRLLMTLDTMRWERRNSPSVTTILAATASDEKRASLDKWKAKIGKIEAERVKNTAANRGTAMHSILEYHIEGQGVLDLTDLGQEAHKMANTIIDKGLGDLSEIWVLR
jgi:hypothetical protein